MIRAVIWKEWREQGLIALTLVVLGAGILVAAAALADPPTASASPSDVVRYLGVGRLATLLLAVTAGMVCGGALFAAEREAGTMAFLDSLPASRARLWAAKVAAGLALAAGQIGLVLAVAGALGQVGTTGFAVAVLVYALLAFAWGALGSTAARTTLGSVGVAIPAASLASIVFLLPIMLLFARPGVNWPRPEGGLLFLALMFLSPLGVSALLFTRPDRDRAADDLTAGPWAATPTATRPDAGPPAPAGRGRARLGLRALLWLATRQLRLPGAVASGFALTAGLTLLVPTVIPVLAWPILGLTAGVLAGVTTFADEQGHGVARFWGERRLPVGRLWAAKTAVHALFAVWLTALVLLPSVAAAASAPLAHGARGQWLLSGVFRTLLFDELHYQGWKFVLAPVAYGFAAGHVCGLLFRKAVVGAGVAGLAGGTAAALWLPSLLAGGVWHWQVWLPPAAALGVARLLVRDWAADRVFARGPLVTLGAGLVAVAVIEAAGIGYRVVEVPDPPGGEADVAFVATLPEFDLNLGGRDFRTAAERYSRVAAAATATAERASPRAPRVEDRLETVLQGGWPTDRPVDPQLEPALVGVGGGAGAAARADRFDPELDRWVNDVYADKPASPDDRTWYDWAELAALRPYAAFEDPRQFAGLTATALLPMENARRLALAVLVRGLQRQAAGDHAAFVGAFRVATALARSLRNRSIIPAAQVGYGVERLALVAAHVWARNLPAAGTADRLAAAYLLSQVLAADPDPDPHAPFDPTPHLLAQRYVLRGLLSAPNQWLPDAITPPGKSKDAAGPEADLVSFAWTVPWERERTRRLVGAAYEAADRHGPYPLVRGRPGAQLLVAWGTAPTDLADLDRAVRAYRRGLAVCLAVRLFETGGGRPPASVEELVAAKCLPQVPPDPFDGQPVRYRVSAGEVLTSSVRPGPGGRGTDVPLTYTVAAGRPVIWLVGPDRIDQGGRQVPILPAGFPRQEDWVFLVP